MKYRRDLHRRKGSVIETSLLSRQGLLCQDISQPNVNYTGCSVTLTPSADRRLYRGDLIYPTERGGLRHTLRICKPNHYSNEKLGFFSSLIFFSLPHSPLVSLDLRV